MANLIKAIFLGIIEGITEWLPVSSTGHLILFGSFLQPDLSDAFMSMFNVVIQLGAIMAVVIIYFRKIWPFHRKGVFEGRSQFARKASGGLGKFQSFADNYLYMDKIIMWIKIAISLIPAVLIGLPLDDWLDENLYKPLPVAVMLILYGILFIVVENLNASRRPTTTAIRGISWKDALLIGLFQCLALIPGTSRSGATILGGILIGFSRTCAAEYTFYLAIPTMFGASLLKLIKYGFGFTAGEVGILLVGSITAFAVSYVTIRFFMNFIRRHSFKSFGYYRIMLGAAVLVLAVAGAVNA
ncbi:MAG: undecaprenyl-diphosphate phosphatase [Eubacterium sp.]|nr:undecaprenyl-diphosphate phosphatase [Eubacterium sp.]